MWRMCFSRVCAILGSSKGKLVKKNIIFTIVFFCVAAVASAQAISVDYLDGTVELKSAKGWDSVSIGDTLAATATVRVSGGGVLELTRGAQRFSIVKDGTYAVADLLKSADKMAKPGTGVSLAQKIKTISSQQQGQGSVAGVRGAQQGGKDDLMWAEEGDDVRDTVTQLLASQKYGEAADTLTKALKDAAADEKPELEYLLATAYYDGGETARAFRAVSVSSPGSDQSYYPDFMILKTQILLDSAAYQDGIAAANQLLANKPAPQYAQVAYLLSAYCAKALGDQKAVQAAVSAGVALDPQSETAKLLTDSGKAP